MTEPLYSECRELGDLDEFEFFVEAIPFKFSRKEREYINALPKGSQIRVALENQLDEFTENVVGGNTSLFGVFNQSEGLNWPFLLEIVGGGLLSFTHLTLRNGKNSIHRSTLIQLYDKKVTEVGYKLGLGFLSFLGVKLL